MQNTALKRRLHVSAFWHTGKEWKVFRMSALQSKTSCEVLEGGVDVTA